jgi:hypothetical protein
MLFAIWAKLADWKTLDQPGDLTEFARHVRLIRTLA